MTAGLTPTGHLREVTKESAHAALSWMGGNAARYGIDPGFHEKIDVHAPEGAVPKDGPSVGVTMATALVSELASRTVRGDLAMSGEVRSPGTCLDGGRGGKDSARGRSTERTKRPSRRRPTTSTPRMSVPGPGTGTITSAPVSVTQAASAGGSIGYGILLPSAAPVRLPGQNEDLPGPDEGRTNVHGFSDTVESSIPSPVAVMAVLPSTTGTVSALQTCNLSMLSSPARSRPCQRFACRLTATGA